MMAWVRAIEMKFQTQAQQICYEKVERWMEEMFSDIPWEKLDEPGFGLFMGSAWVEVHIYDWDEDDSLINVRSVVVTGAELTQDLLLYLLRENDELQFGAFAISSAGEILFQHTIVGSTCDPGELEASVREVLELADEYDDRITVRWGGQRALERGL